MSEIDIAYSEMKENMVKNETSYSEKQLNQARLAVWMDKLSKHVRQNIMLSEDEFKSLYPEQEYAEYEKYMELKVMEDLLTDEQSALAASYFGENSVKLLLDADTAVGERNKRYADKLLAFRQGLIDFEKSLDALTTALPKTGGTLRGAGGYAGDGGFTFVIPGSNKAEEERQLRLRDRERDERIRNCRIKGRLTLLEQASSTNSEITHC